MKPYPFRRIVRSRDIDPRLLSSNKINGAIKELGSDEGSFTNLRHMSEEASRRLPDLLSSFHLAANLSYEKGVLWMDITDAARSLSDCHEFLKEANKASLEIVTDKNKFLQFRSRQVEFFHDKKEGVRLTMQARAKEWLELVAEWRSSN